MSSRKIRENQKESVVCCYSWPPWPFAPPCLSVETPWLTAGPTKATGKNDRHPMDVWKLMARLVRWQQKSLPTKYLPNFISKGLVFYFQQEGDEIPNLDSPW